MNNQNQKPNPSKIISLRINQDIYDRLAVRAVIEMRTMTGFINFILKEYLEKD